MRAEIKWIDSLDHPSWVAFVATELPDPTDGFGWFRLDIGTERDPASDTETFDVLVSTPAAVPRAQSDRSRFRGVIVPLFEPEVIEETLREHVAARTGRYWDEIVTQLRRTMKWEYEGRYPHLER